MEFAFTGDLDEARGLEFLHVMGERGRGDREVGEDLGAAQRAACFGDAFQKLKSLGIGERLEDGGASGAAETSRLGGIC